MLRCPLLFLSWEIRVVVRGEETKRRHGRLRAWVADGSGQHWHLTCIMGPLTWPNLVCLLPTLYPTIPPALRANHSLEGPATLYHTLAWWGGCILYMVEGWEVGPLNATQAVPTSPMPVQCPPPFH